MKSHAWQEVPRSKVERFASIALAEAPEIAQKILTEIRQDYPYLQLVEDESGEPMALVGIRRAIEGFVRHLASGAADPGCPRRSSRSSAGARGCTGAPSTPPGRLPARRPAHLAQVRRDRPAGRHRRPRHVRAGRIRLRVSGRPRGTVGPGLRRGGGPPCQRAAAPPAPADRPAPGGAPRRLRPYARRAGGPGGLGAAGDHRRGRPDAPRPGGRGPRGGAGDPAGDGERAAPHRHPRPGDGRPGGDPAPGHRRLVRRDRPVGPAGRRRHLVALGRDGRPADQEEPAAPGRGAALHRAHRGAGAPTVPGADRRRRPPLPRTAGRPRPDRRAAAGRDPARLDRDARGRPRGRPAARHPPADGPLPAPPDPRAVGRRDRRPRPALRNAAGAPLTEAEGSTGGGGE